VHVCYKTKSESNSSVSLVYMVSHEKQATFIFTITFDGKSGLFQSFFHFFI